MGRDVSIFCIFTSIYRCSHGVKRYLFSFPGKTPGGQCANYLLSRQFNLQSRKAPLENVMLNNKSREKLFWDTICALRLLSEQSVKSVNIRSIQLLS